MILPVPLKPRRAGAIGIIEARNNLLPYLSMESITKLEVFIRQDFLTNGCGNLKLKEGWEEVVDRVSKMDLPVDNSEMIMLVHHLQEFWDLALAARTKAVNITYEHNRKKTGE
ncbi:hypothetical protein EDC01DRAFT_731742 [Geopyxis carbonaria]|nr:hypothetical protein EDC01DRAFT_731742 [Geopyxis carbonaria]